MSNNKPAESPAWRPPGRLLEEALASRPRETHKSAEMSPDGNGSHMSVVKKLIPVRGR